jgi:DNA polymerase type B, organellar and viral
MGAFILSRMYDITILLVCRGGYSTVSKLFPIGKENWHKRGPNSHSGINSKSGPTHGPRKRNPKPWNPEFIGIDGEGFTDDAGAHHYFLLASSDGTHVSNPIGLTTNQCFEFLFDVHLRNPHSVMVCYGASYDINMMLKGIDEETVKFIHKKAGVVHIDGYRYWIRYTPRKMLQLSKWENDKRISVTLYDCIGFFQQPFIDAIRDWLGADYIELETITAGKARRSQFEVSEFDSILAYCQAELRALVLIMNAVRDSLRAADIKISQWYGPGAIASSLLKEYHMRDNMYDTFHKENRIYRAAQHAFAGGRIELMKYGLHDGPVYHYDINSAYPSVIADLPSMKGRWYYQDLTSVALEMVTSFALYHIKWRTKKDVPFYPFHYRNPNGNIYFPSTGEGWYWGVEVNAGLDFNGDIELIECYWYRPYEHTKPFGWVRKLYEQRKVWKQEGNAAHKTLKLGINSLYGKLIQHVGGDEHTNKLPAFHQLEWAGYITACTRAKLYTAGMQNPEAIIGFQTDGIFSTEPLDLDFGDGLGQWNEEPQCTRGLFVQTGIYWIWEQGNGNVPVSHYRGFDAGVLRPEIILRGWRTEKSHVELPSTRFITMGSGANGRYRDWCSWLTVDRELKLSPNGTKRTNLYAKSIKPYKELVETQPTDLFYRNGISEPYGLPWETWDYEPDRVDGIKSVEYENEFEETYI